MNYTLQWIAVGLLILWAIVKLVLSLVKQRHRNDTSNCCGCDGCDLKNQCDKKYKEKDLLRKD